MIDDGLVDLCPSSIVPDFGIPCCMLSTTCAQKISVIFNMNKKVSAGALVMYLMRNTTDKLVSYKGNNAQEDTLLTAKLVLLSYVSIISFLSS